MPSPSNHVQVFLPTRGRINKQITMDKFFLYNLFVGNTDLLPEWLTFKIIVPESERREYLKAHRWTREFLDTVPDDFKFGSVCQYIADSSTGYTLIIDDDMRLLRRRNLLDPSQIGGTGTEQDARDLFNRVRRWLSSGYAHGGISLRQSNHFVTGAYFKTKTRICGTTFFDARILREEGIKFNAVQARSDFHVYLSLLELGYLNVCDYEFIVGQDGTGTNAPGGCSQYRTSEFQREQAELLASLHPGTVSLIYKKRKGTGLRALESRDGEGIPDVRISWDKAYGIRMDKRSNSDLAKDKLRKQPDE